jgi:hypothetical protein
MNRLYVECHCDYMHTWPLTNSRVSIFSGIPILRVTYDRVVVVTASLGENIDVNQKRIDKATIECGFM